MNQTIHNELVKNGWSCKAGPCVAGPCVAGPCVAGPCVAGPCVAGPCVADSCVTAISYSIKDNKFVDNKYIYRKSQPYDEFIIELNSSDEVSITVPIPFRESSIAYKNTFRSENIAEIYEYIKLHLSNNNNRYVIIA